MRIGAAIELQLQPARGCRKFLGELPRELANELQFALVIGKEVVILPIGKFLFAGCHFVLVGGGWWVVSGKHRSAPLTTDR